MSRPPLDPATAILAYLAAHPQASDSIEGIVSWWLPAAVTGGRDRVQATLDRLVEQHLVERTRLADGTIVYGRPRGEDE